MGEFGKQPTAAGKYCRKAYGPSIDDLPATRWLIKKRILKELVFGNKKQAPGDGDTKPPATRWKIKKQLLKDLFWTTTSV